MLNLGHKNLEVYKNGMEYVRQVYLLTADFPKSETYGLSSLLRRAAVSIVSNLAKGAARKSAKERKRFYEISGSSLGETDTQIEIALSLDYFSRSNALQLEKLMSDLFARLTALINNKV